MITAQEKPVCKMMGDIGDKSHFIDKVVSLLRLTGKTKEADEFYAKAVEATNCEDLTKVILQYVNVE